MDGLGLAESGIYPLAFGGTADGLALLALLDSGSSPIHRDGGGGQLGQPARRALDSAAGAHLQALAAAGAVEAVDDGHQTLAALDAARGAGFHTGAAALAEFGVHIELGQGQADAGGAFPAADMGLNLAFKGIQGGENRQSGLLAQGAVAGKGHGAADLFGQFQIGGLGPAGGHCFQQAIQLVPALPAEGAFAAAFLPQHGQLVLGLLHRAMGRSEAAYRLMLRMDTASFT